MFQYQEKKRAENETLDRGRKWKKIVCELKYCHVSFFLHFKLSKQQKNGKIRTTSAIDEWHGLYEHFSKHAILLIFLLSSQDLGRIFKFRIGKMSYFVCVGK